MARPRKPGTEWRPPQVYLGKGRYYLRDEDGTEVWLAPAGATPEDVWKAYSARPKAAPAPVAAMTLRKFLNEYMASARFRKKLSYGTQDDAAKAFKAMCNCPMKDGRPFGDLEVLKVAPVVMQKYIDKRGEKSENRANKELSYSSRAFRWAIPREIGGLKSNPCEGIERYTPVERDRYVEHEEYQQRIDLCMELGRPDIAVMMELSYLGRMREHEILKILDTPQFVGPSGVLARRGKGSKTQIITWTQRLEEVVALAREIKKNPRWKKKSAVETLCLVTSVFTGAPLHIGTFKNEWARIRWVAIERGHSTDWTFHDLKAKGVTDFEGDKHQASGHKTHRMTQLYNRKPEKVEATR